MSLTLSYTEATKPAVVVALAGLPSGGGLSAGDVKAIVQRSTDGVIYRTVRGLAEAPATTGSISNVDDYEFGPDVVNTYRAGTVQEVIDIFTRTTVSGFGTATTGQTWQTGAAFSTSGFVASILHSAANTTFENWLDTPASAHDFTYRVSMNPSTTPTVAPMRSSMRFRRVDASNYYRMQVVWSHSAGALTATLDVVLAGVVTTLASTPLSFTHSGSSTTVIGKVWCQGTRIRGKLWSSATAEPSTWTFDVRVGTSQYIAAGQVGVSSTRDTGNTNSNPSMRFDNMLVDTGTPTWLFTGATITPALSRVWFESVQRSFLNLAPMVVDFSEPSRTGRGAESYVNGRTLPIAQGELMTGRDAGTIRVRVADVSAWRTLEYLLASGDFLFVQTPAACPIPRGYFRVRSFSGQRVRQQGAPRYCDIALTEIAAPGPDIVTASATWATVVALYGTWADVVVAQPTWEDLLTLAGSPTEVIVP